MFKFKIPEVDGLQLTVQKDSRGKKPQVLYLVKKFPVFLLASSLDAAILPLLLAFILTEYNSDKCNFS